jgi:hypothetical protein
MSPILKNYFELSKNGITTHQNLCDTAKAVLKGNFMNAYIRKEERCRAAGQVVECLPSKCEALSSNPVLPQKKVILTI